MILTYSGIASLRDPGRKPRSRPDGSQICHDGRPDGGAHPPRRSMSSESAAAGAVCRICREGAGLAVTAYISRNRMPLPLVTVTARGAFRTWSSQGCQGLRRRARPLSRDRLDRDVRGCGRDILAGLFPHPAQGRTRARRATPQDSPVGSPLGVYSVKKGGFHPEIHLPGGMLPAPSVRAGRDRAGGPYRGAVGGIRRELLPDAVAACHET